MIITRKFVVINYPKTGTTFLRAAVKKVCANHETLRSKILVRAGLLGPSFRELLLPKLYGSYDVSYLDQHGVYRQIPNEHREKTVISIIRNPLTRFVSSYLFGWWKLNPPFDISLVVEAFPSFPDLSFYEFYRLLQHPLVSEDRLCAKGSRSLGGYTRMFLVFYAHNPDAAASRVLSGEPLESVLPPIIFLHQEQLRSELKSFFELMSYSEEDMFCIDAIDNLNASSVQDKAGVSSQDVQKVARSILQDEKALLCLFPEYRELIQRVSRGLTLEKAGLEESYGLRHVGSGTPPKKWTPQG